MTSPMPRDSLGRIVYVGDVLDGGAVIMTILRDDEAKIAFPTGGVGFIPLRFVEICLAASPLSTNYERYFADLGAREEVEFAFFSWPCKNVDAPECVTCPFELVAGECRYFPVWLDEKAVV
ncbi:hypothetical protein [Eggerthella timonensis]|uniref:hypothetical protein n=1 Tax=Eggerthella timonensis TaxID=1871008 RepID=UPI000C779C45|nr:hypothetical protein [Eggerthella timonensis]